MFKDLSRRKKLSLYYLIISLVLILLSCFGLFFNEWVLIVNMAICSLFGYFNLLLFLKSEKDMDKESGVKSSFALYTFLRYSFMVVGLLLSAVLVYLTMGSEVNNNRYFMVVISALAYLSTSICFLISK
ncbi:MAG: hypothetical protein SOW55_06040 [Bacilli bacterium]|nr:hypothetical protein [Bacillales bacterium]MDY2575508.1 hypothetical protein [Bacilli bacterium]